MVKMEVWVELDGFYFDQSPRSTPVLRAR